ncbi:MAG: ribosome biogenesis GTP-binding protein YihA/YsxC [Saprospiraceae bacterium]|nr:ribosome biogenesis GTP-binding protein YihA/YsxC [Saprospiraceae bacterium]
MKIVQVEYIGSYHREDLCPKDGLPEFAFIGRSNVGKSSLINNLIHRKDLARVSKEPGKTQSLNYYLVDQNWYIVDLPGYGYARTSQSNRENWIKMIHYYLKNRQTLVTAFVLLDSRHTLQKIDREFMEWCAMNGVPFCIIYTKADKMSGLALQQNLKGIETEMLKEWDSMPTTFVSSAETGVGKEDILSFIEKLMKNF